MWPTRRGSNLNLLIASRTRRQLIKDKLIDLINRTFIRENTQYLACNKECAFFISDVYNITIFGRVKKSVMPLFIFWITFLLDLELNFIDKLLVFRWELIVLLLLQICFVFVMREISWSLSHVKIRLTLLSLSIQLQDTLTIIKYWQYLLWPNGGPDIPYRTPIN